MPNLIRLTLTNGEARHLDAPDGFSAGMVAERLNRPGTHGEWIKTLENTLVRRDQIIEAMLVQDATHPARLADYV